MVDKIVGIIIWFLSLKKSEVQVLLLCKENENTDSTLVIC